MQLTYHFGPYRAIFTSDHGKVVAHLYSPSGDRLFGKDLDPHALAMAGVSLLQCSFTAAELTPAARGAVIREAFKAELEASAE